MCITKKKAHLKETYNFIFIRIIYSRLHLNVVGMGQKIEIKRQTFIHSFVSKRFIQTKLRQERQRESARVHPRARKPENLTAIWTHEQLNVPTGEVVHPRGLQDPDPGDTTNQRIAVSET